MKKIFIALLLLFLIVIAALLVFLFTFDANQYKDLLIERIEDSIGKDVKMGNISLNFLPGLALRIDELSIKDNDKTWGDAVLDAESISAGVKLLPLIKKDIQLQHLNIKELNVNITKDFTSLAQPVFRDIELKGTMREGDIAIRRLTGLAAGGHFSVKGSVKDIFRDQYSEFDIRLKEINVDELVPAVPPDRPQFEGKLSMDMHCSARGLDAQEILDTLSAKGTAVLDKAVLKNINVLNVALGKLNSILPGLVQKLKSSIPERYSGLLKQNYTAFKPIETGFDIKDGRLFFQKTTIESDAFYMIGSGSVSIKGDLEISADFFIPADLSAAFIDGVHELKYLQNNRGMITMPVTIIGRIPDISVKPDMDYVMQRLAVATGEELLRSIFRKGEPRSAESDNSGETGPEGETQSQQQQEKRKPEPEEVLIKTIFDIISGPKE